MGFGEQLPLNISLKKELSSAFLSTGKREVQRPVGSGQGVAGPNILKCCHGELANIHTHTVFPSSGLGLFGSLGSGR